MSASTVVLALDVMGGDDAPHMVLKSLNLARKRYPGVRFLLFGDDKKIQPFLDAKDGAVSTIVHTSGVISDDDKPSQAVHRGRKSSMWRAIEAVKNGDAHAVVSAGNTGALMAMAKVCLRTLPGIDRPAIATILPTVRGESVMLDLGANSACDANNLVEFAVMGEVFARSMLGLDRASVGLLNIGSEDLKGTDVLRGAAAILRDGAPETMEFRGFVEGDGIGEGLVDVIVADGFTGNVALKTVEGTARLYSAFLGEAFKASILAKIGCFLAKPALRAVRKRMDPRRYNGAMFLGLNGVCVKSHGGTDHVGFANAIGVAVNLLVSKLNDQIKNECAHVLGKGKLRSTAARELWRPPPTPTDPWLRSAPQSPPRDEPYVAVDHRRRRILSAGAHSDECADDADR